MDYDPGALPFGVQVSAIGLRSCCSGLGLPAVETALQRFVGHGLDLMPVQTRGFRFGYGSADRTPANAELILHVSVAAPEKPTSV